MEISKEKPKHGESMGAAKKLHEGWIDPLELRKQLEVKYADLPKDRRDQLIQIQLNALKLADSQVSPSSVSTGEKDLSLARSSEK